MEKKYQVFISSTYKDLKVARKKVTETILSMGHFPVGMEMFGAGDDEQWKTIKETIDTSDYYVIIVGKCFGTIVPEGDISYTQKEFHYAKEKNIPILAFLINDDADVSKTHKEKDSFRIYKLDEFREELQKGRTVDYWSNPDELARKVAVSLDKEIRKHPRPGWIRVESSQGNQYERENSETLTLEQLDKHYDEKYGIDKSVIELLESMGYNNKQPKK